MWSTIWGCRCRPHPSSKLASHNTHENAILSAPLLKRLGARRLLVVTDRLHMTRAGGAFAGGLPD